MEELFGCWREAERCRRVATELVRIRNALNLESFEDISAVLNEIESASRLLRDLHDLFPIYRSRVHFVIYYLSVILPCLCKTLRDMLIYVDNSALVPRAQWSLMYERMGEQGGMPLAARFVMYNEFLVQLIRLLCKSPLYDPTSLELLRIRVLRLRQLRGIPDTKKMESLLVPLARLAPQVPVQPHLAPVQPRAVEIERRHWAEKIFDEQPHSTTGLRHRRRPFDRNRLSITLYLHGADITKLLCRWTDPNSNPQYSCFGVNELCIKRRGSALQLRRWSDNKANATLWVALFFKSWERMVLFHAAFVALKSRCPLTLNVNPEDYRLLGERKLFQALILDDGFQHSLAVYQDTSCNGLRLHAAVWSGELRKCPVWTAFVTYTCGSPDWMVRKGRHRIWLKGLHPYVFCKEYKKRHQQKRHGEFELDFADEAATDAFVEVFALDSDGIDTLDGDRAVTAGDGAAGGGGG